MAEQGISGISLLLEYLIFIYIYKNSWHIINKYEWTAYCTVCMYDSYNTVKCVDKIVAYCTYMYRCDSYE